MTRHSITLPVAKPRNPLVAPALHRQAGAHRSGTGSRRQQDQADLRREVREWHSPPPRV